MTKKKTGRRSARVEVWKGKRVKVARSPRGRFVSWHRIRAYRRGITAKQKWIGTTGRLTYAGLGQPTGKSLSVYGTVMTKKGIQSRRWELHKGLASFQEWITKVGEARQHPPKTCLRHIYVQDLDSDEYEGKWIDTPEIEST